MFLDLKKKRNCKFILLAILNPQKYLNKAFENYALGLKSFFAVGDKWNGTTKSGNNTPKFSCFDLKNLFLVKNRLNGHPKRNKFKSKIHVLGVS